MSELKGYFIITGTSKGIGEALAIALLEDNHQVFGISRSQSTLAAYENYHHEQFDLGDTVKIGQMLNEVIGKMEFTTDYNMICLVNNAAMLEPIKAIEESTPAEVTGNLNVNLIAPIMMSSQFIKLTEKPNPYMF